MCKSCHSGLSDESVISQLQTAVNNPKFEVWNETSISHMYIAAVGANGPTAQKLAKQLLDRYVQWKEQNSFESDGSFFGNPTVDYVKKVIDEVDVAVNKFNKLGYTKEQIRHDVLN